jgi:hypothetical protein
MRGEIGIDPAYRRGFCRSSTDIHGVRPRVASAVIASAVIGSAVIGSAVISTVAAVVIGRKRAHARS